MSRTIERSLKPDSQLRDELQPGKRALGAYATRVHEAESQVTDSVDFDEATRRAGSSDSRWDYFLGLGSGSIIGVEVHPASDKEVKAIIAKKAASSPLIAQELAPGAKVSKWVWIATGRNSVSKNSRFARELAAKRIELVGRQLRV